MWFALMCFYWKIGYHSHIYLKIRNKPYQQTGLLHCSVGQWWFWSGCLCLHGWCTPPSMHLYLECPGLKLAVVKLVLSHPPPSLLLSPGIPWQIQKLCLSQRKAMHSSTTRAGQGERRAHCLSCEDRQVVVSILYVYNDGGGAGELNLFPTVLGLHQDGVFFCFLWRKAVIIQGITRMYS